MGGANIIEYDELGRVIDATATDKNQLDQAEPVYSQVEVMPEFPGGEMALKRFIAKTLRYPVKAQEAGIQGKVYVSFIVDKNLNF